RPRKDVYVARCFRGRQLLGVGFRDRHAETTELPAHDRAVALVLDDQERMPAADGKGRGSRHFTTRRWVGRFATASPFASSFMPIEARSRLDRYGSGRSGACASQKILNRQPGT